ncbi:receptor-binding cancer antigen expressed on SiSo cells-like [Littorina saxatilis]|uniref:Receptor-binding cancer antigen expressed on SiSo cells n=1 Tax=Littorina saxatilis TaxID=31220 RepID=A0AAN9AQY4_9CAEN
MIKVVFNIIKSIFSLIFSIFRPLKRLWCRRLKVSEMDPGVPTTVSTHSLSIEMPVSLDSAEAEDIEMESWDAWDTNQSQSAQAQQYSQSNVPYYQNEGIPGGMLQHTANQYIRGRKPEPEGDPEPEPDYFRDMTPEVKRPAKILLKKKDNGAVNPAAISTRLSASEVAPPVGSELESWEDPGAVESSWGEEVNEDLSWEAEAALKEKRRAERENRAVEQQKKKLQRDAMRGLKKDHSQLAVKIS